jgi:hypothetical protein
VVEVAVVPVLVVPPAPVVPVALEVLVGLPVVALLAAPPAPSEPVAGVNRSPPSVDSPHPNHTQVKPAINHQALRMR